MRPSGRMAPYPASSFKPRPRRNTHAQGSPVLPAGLACPAVELGSVDVFRCCSRNNNPDQSAGGRRPDLFKHAVSLNQQAQQQQGSGRPTSGLRSINNPTRPRRRAPTATSTCRRPEETRPRAGRGWLIQLPCNTAGADAERHDGATFQFVGAQARNASTSINTAIHRLAH